MLMEVAQERNNQPSDRIVRGNSLFLQPKLIRFKGGRHYAMTSCIPSAYEEITLFVTAINSPPGIFTLHRPDGSQTLILIFTGFFGLGNTQLYLLGLS